MKCQVELLSVGVKICVTTFLQTLSTYFPQTVLLCTQFAQQELCIPQHHQEICYAA